MGVRVRAWGLESASYLGQLFGAFVAMLFAPKVGSEIRRDIADGVADVGRAAKDQWESAAATVSSAIDEGRAEYERTVAAARDNPADSSVNSVTQLSQA